ncbi:MAG: hypothetical protein JWP61_1544, partial [Friedmanniella sp.]|nr:hypothetical protein [Friedmanniella sp.]
MRIRRGAVARQRPGNGVRCAVP